MKIRWGLVNVVGVFLFFAVVFGLFSVIHASSFKAPLNKDFSLYFLNAYDVANYHLYNGATFWNARPHDITADNNFAYASHLLDAIHVKFFSWFPDFLANFFWGACEGLIGGILFLMALKMFGLDSAFKSKTSKGFLIFCSFLAVLISVTSPTILSEAGTFHSGDVVAVLFFLGWLFFISGWFNLVSPGEDGAGSGRQVLVVTSFLLFGVFIGMSLGLKLTLYPFIFSLAVCLVVWAFFSRNIFSYVLVFLCGVGVLLGFFLIQGPQMWELYEQFGNPVFPTYNNLFKSVYFSPVLPAKNPIPFAMGTKSLLLFPLKLLSLSYGLSMESFLRDWRLLLAFMAGVFITIDFFRTPKAERRFTQKVLFFIFSFCVMGYVIWAHTFGVYRYAFPLQIFSGFLIVYGVISLLKSWQSCWRNMALIFITWFLIITTVPSPLWSSLTYTPVKNFPKLPLDSIVILPGNTQSFWALFLPKEVSAINPNFYPPNTIYFTQALKGTSKGKIFLSMSKEESNSLSFNKLFMQLKAGKPVFLLEDSYSISRDKLTQPYQMGDAELKEVGPCYPLEYPFYGDPDRKIKLCQVVF